MDQSPAAEAMKANIRAHALALGFDNLRVASPDLPAHYQRQFEDWLARGQQADMQWLARRLTESDPVRSRLPEAACVLALAANYYLADEPPAPGPGEGVVSRYAVGRDYHRILGGKLRRLCAYIREEHGGEARGYVDTGPFLERAYAEAAGLGYIGRNSMLITESCGSWVFLAVVLCTLPLPPDAPVADRSCGACRRCLEACPTGAINDDCTVDAAKCISYLTIENRGEIPAALWPGIGNRLFGCDACQEACPHNARPQTATMPELQQTRLPRRCLPLGEIMELSTDEQFVARFAGSPLMRAKRLGLVRNASIVAANAGLPELTR